VKIGVISDTHGFLDPRVEKIFAGVKHIIHAGDVCDPMIEPELRCIAPVTAVLGNCDGGLSLPLTAGVEIGGKKFLAHHIVNPHALENSFAARIRRDRPDAVIFGHTHRKFAETLDGIFFLNPGYSGKPRAGVERSVAILHLDAKGLRAEFVPL
jgi:putative phosphoesterase